MISKRLILSAGIENIYDRKKRTRFDSIQLVCIVRVYAQLKLIFIIVCAFPLLPLLSVHFLLIELPHIRVK